MENPEMAKRIRENLDTMWAMVVTSSEVQKWEFLNLLNDWSREPETVREWLKRKVEALP